MTKNQIKIRTAVRITENEVFINKKPLQIDAVSEDWLTSIYKKLKISYPKFFKMDNLCKAGFLAAELCAKECGLETREEGNPNWSVAVFNQTSSLDNDQAYQKTIDDPQNYFPSPSIFVYTLSNIVTGEIAIRHKLKGESCSYILPKFDAQMIEETGRICLEQKGIDNLLIGWVEYLDGKCDVLMFHLTTGSTTNAPESWDLRSINNFFFKFAKQGESLKNN